MKWVTGLGGRAGAVVWDAAGVGGDAPGRARALPEPLRGRVHPRRGEGAERARGAAREA